MNLRGKNCDLDGWFVEGGLSAGPFAVGVGLDDRGSSHGIPGGLSPSHSPGLPSGTWDARGGVGLGAKIKTLALPVFPSRRS